MRESAGLLARFAEHSTRYVKGLLWPLGRGEKKKNRVCASDDAAPL